MSIVLIGARGCGKTSIGRKLADRLWYKFVDVDELIVRKAGKTIREIFEQDGETKFRDIETKVVHEVAPLEEHVIALGGGSLVREENRQIIREAGHRMIYLRCEAQELHRRIQADPNSAATRPSLTKHGGGLGEIEHLLSEREPVYRQCMQAELDVTNLTPEEASVRLVKLM